MGVLTWTGVDGFTVTLDGTAGLTVAEGTEGLFEIPTDLVTALRVGGDGGILVSARRSPRAATLTLLIESATTVIDVWRPMLVSLARGGSLSYAASGTSRTLRDVVLESPARSLTGYDLGAVAVDAVSVSLLALDPWWYGPPEMRQVSLSVTPTAFNASAAFNAPIPFNGGAAVGFEVEGDVAASPRFVFAGPYTTATVALTADLVIEADRALTVSDAMEVDTRPGSRGPHYGSELLADRPVGLIDWSWISERSRLFEFPPGVVSLQLGSVGATVDSTLWVWWEPRFLTP